MRIRVPVNQVLAFVLLIFSGFITTGCVQSGSSYDGHVADLEPRKARQKVIVHDPGGQVIQYALKSKKMEKQGQEVRFAGRCDSACTLYLSMPKHLTCISPGASFLFHAPYGGSKSENRTAHQYLVKSYPRWVKRWIRSRGGLENQAKVMGYDYAKRFIQPCDGRMHARQHRAA